MLENVGATVHEVVNEVEEEHDSRGEGMLEVLCRVGFSLCLGCWQGDVHDSHHTFPSETDNQVEVHLFVLALRS